MGCCLASHFTLSHLKELSENNPYILELRPTYSNIEYDKCKNYYYINTLSCSVSYEKLLTINQFIDEWGFDEKIKVVFDNDDLCILNLFE